MKRMLLLFGSAIVSAAALQQARACEPAAPDALFESFRSPATPARPFVRWWWNGGRVEAAEIVREIDLLHRAGIGGVEINTIGMERALAGPNLDRHPEVPWLSPRWVEMVRVAAGACRQRGMTADVIVGSGWPFGGRFLASEEQTKRVLLLKTAATGPGTVRLDLRAMIRRRFEEDKAKAAAEGMALTEPTASDVLFLRSIPAGALSGAFEPGTEHAALAASDGSAAFDVPAGEHLVYLGVRQTGFTHVKMGAPGADGPVVDHFDAAAVRHYLDTMSAALAPAFDGGMGAGLRAAFVDSLELDHANWTGDLRAEFAKRRGYDVLPYLPFLLDTPSDDPSAFNDTVLRARYDFCRTLTELFEERFIRTCTAWAEASGVQARMQAYGREAHPLHGSMSVHLPEGETWLWMDERDPRAIRIESTTANKYVASAANLTGQRHRSFEAMTNTVPVFRETLETFKQATDLTLLSGLNHPVLHGFNYSPPDAGYPGWVRYGSWFSEHNPWWPHLRLFTDYAARLGTVMRATDAQASVALLAPRPREWARHGLLYQPFPEARVPWYQYKLAEAVHQAGANADFVSERILEQAAFTDGKLRFGPRAYGVLVLEDAAEMEPAAAVAIARFVECGGTLVVVGRRPSQAPGLADAPRRDAEVRASFARAEAAALRGAGTLLFEEPPPEDALLAWTTRMLARARAPLDAVFDRPRATLSQVFHRDAERTFHFLVNTDPKEPLDTAVSFPASRGTPSLWDPHTGTRHPLAATRDGSLPLRFAPLESKLVVFEPASSPPLPPACGGSAPLDGPATVLRGPWQVEFRVAGTTEVFHRELPELVDLSLHQDPLLKDFGGVLVYGIEFSTPEPVLAAFDLGHVSGVTEVRLDGTSLGVQWWGRRVFEASGRLEAGAHRLEIEVTTPLANQMRSMRGNSMAQRWAWWAPPIEMGLVQPVRLLQRSAAPPPVRSVSARP
jgi:hypothetical protein